MRKLLTLAEVEKRWILRVLACHHGNRTQAARALGIGRATLHRRLADWRLLDHLKRNRKETT